MKQIVQDAIMALRDKHGNVSDKQIFEAAKDPGNALHTEANFIWNGDAAVEKLGLERAGELLREFTFVITKRNIEFNAPVFVRNVDLPSNVAGHSWINAIQKDPEKAERTIDAEVAAVVALAARGRAEAIVFGLEDEFEEKLARALGFSVAPPPRRPTKQRHSAPQHAAQISA